MIFSSMDARRFPYIFILPVFVYATANDKLWHWDNRAPQDQAQITY